MSGESVSGQGSAKRPLGAASDETPCAFKIRVARRQPRPAEFRRVSQLTIGAAPPPPPEAVVRKLGHDTMVVGVDIETANWVDTKQSMAKGQYGHFHFCHPDNFQQKIVQIGWALGEAREAK